jgi:hypothetical protein
MAGLNMALLAALVVPNLKGGVVDLQYRGTDFLDLLRANGLVKISDGPAPFKWGAISAVNSSIETFVEGQAPPAEGSQTYIQASLDVFGVRGVTGETGHVRDNREKSNAFVVDPFDAEKMLAEADIFGKIEDTLMGSTQDQGIASIIDSTGTYAGLAQSTYSAWASEENAVSGAQTVSALNTLYEEMTLSTNSSVPRGSNLTHVLMPVQQITNYTELVGAAASSGGVFRFTNVQDYDLGLIRGDQRSYMTGLNFNGMPICRMRRMTSTEVYMVDLFDMEFLVHRNFRVDPILGNPEVLKYQLSVTGALKVKRRNKHGKQTGVTA